MNRAVFEPLADHRGPLTVEDDFLVLDDAVEQADFTALTAACASATHSFSMRLTSLMATVMPPSKYVSG